MEHIGKYTKYGFVKELYYTIEHSWAKVMPDGSARIGITDFAQKSLGPIIGLELPKKNDAIVQMASFGAIESSKIVSDLYAPLSGIVKEVNRNLFDDPELINLDPFGDGWIIDIFPDNLEEELEKLMSGDAAIKWIRGEVENTGEPVS